MRETSAAVYTNCQTASAARHKVVEYRLQIELVNEAQNHPFPVAATALLTRPHSHQLSSVQTPGACPDDKPAITANASY